MSVANMPDGSFSAMMKRLYPDRRVEGFAGPAAHLLMHIFCGVEEHWPPNVRRVRKLARKWYIPRFIGRRLVKRERDQGVEWKCPSCSVANYRMGP